MVWMKGSSLHTHSWTFTDMKFAEQEFDEAVSEVGSGLLLTAYDFPILL
jgi:hypothetical protein